MCGGGGGGGHNPVILSTHLDSNNKSSIVKFRA